MPALFAGVQRAPGVGGTRPAPAFPLGGNGKRGSKSLLPQANSGDVELRSTHARKFILAVSVCLSAKTVTFSCPSSRSLEGHSRLPANLDASLLPTVQLL